MDLTKMNRLKRLRMTDPTREKEYLKRLADLELTIEDAMALIDGLIDSIEEDFPFEEVPDEE